MFRKLAVVVSIFFFAPIASRAQSTFVLCNSYMEADVSASDGLVSIFYAPCDAHVNGITQAAGTSYLSVLINGDSIYTNNPNIPLHDPNAIPSFSPAGYLNTGITKFTGPNKDTIETIWEPEDPNTFEIIQDIYLADFPVDGSGQVVYKFRVLNLQNKPLSVQAQYLLDLDVGGNDASPVTTRYGYLQANETSFPNSNNSVPPYFIANQQFLGNSDFPGLIAEGYLNDSLAPEQMGLMQPSLFAYVSWPDLVADPGFTWGFPSTRIDSDDALLFQWPAGASDSGQTQEIGSFSCGTAACSNQICFGNLDAMILHPEHIVWNGFDYVPNHFPVEAVVWNPNNQTATSASGIQSITNANTGLADGPIRIASPLPDTLNGFMQIHSVSNGGTVPAVSASPISWEDTVLEGVLTNCGVDSVYNIAFSVAALGVGSTSCQNGTYICPIEVDCQSKPIITPTTTVLSREGSYDGSICNMRCTEVVAFDTGTVRIPVLSVSADTLINMRLSIAPNHVGADSTFYSVCVIDSMLNGSAEITVTDTLGNSAIEEYTYCTIPDTKAPLVQFVDCIDTENGPCIYEVSDTQAWDRGLDTLYFTNVNGVTIGQPDSVYGLGIVTFNVDGLGSFCVTAIDLAGNAFDTCFGTTASVSIPAPVIISLSMFPNPTSGEVSIFIDGAPSAIVEILDVLGREVDHFQMNQSYDLQTAALPAGTYIVRAVVNGESDAQTITKRIMKE